MAGVSPAVRDLVKDYLVRGSICIILEHLKPFCNSDRGGSGGGGFLGVRTPSFGGIP